MAYTYDDTRAGYANMWRAMSIPTDKLKRVDDLAKKIAKHKETYQAVEKKTGVPWYFVGLLHYRESNCNFNTHLHNGDSLKARTKRVPAGYPKTGTPPFTWEESAIDALKIKSFHKIKEWTIERMLYEAERYNGHGYFGRKVNSPYLWSFTNHYRKGKYVSDGKFSSTAVDKQCGVVPILKRLIELDRAVRPYLQSDKKTIRETIEGSKSLPILIWGMIVQFILGFTDWAQYAFDNLLWLFGLIPALTSEVGEVVNSGKEVAQWFSIPWGSVGTTLALTAMAIVFTRELVRKRTQS